jgi:hypothetical protein
MSNTLSTGADTTEGTTAGTDTAGYRFERETTYDDSGDSTHDPRGVYECLDCGHRCETFLDDCPECGGTAFGAAADAAQTPEHNGVVETGISTVASVAAQLHPLVPR